ncbi:hypothetical protein B0H63DRAFT_400402 [Podospora didyma]|uniref:Uncharacterized protein n=1 Tax=Podospora didyma TaxID=330526 RepID=A0AAE0KDJ2_9PEZI|nr:hypothetical protein B0H63DRAFT_400402 [Podospora didyma]
MRTPTLSLLSASLIFHARNTLGAINWDVYEYGVVESFKWSRPFPDDGTDPGGFHVNCRAEGTFHAKMYKLSDLLEEPPSGLHPWQEGIDHVLRQRHYVGTFDGVDHKGQDREIVMMEWTEVPAPVRHWIEEQQLDESEANENKWLYGVFKKPTTEGERIYQTFKPQPTAAPEGGAEPEKAEVVADKDKIVVFPAGAIYEIAPLWVAKGSKCERELHNLTKYRPQAIDHSILAWVTDHTKPKRELGKRDITFKVEAMAVTETDEGRRSRLMWEKLHRSIKRNDRRIQKEERLKAKKELEQGVTEERVKDEL